ncbi:hypothetical protein [Alteribacter natronophilus]|uniref:hypothetical protein n=1 Tax=Alteribacter natronophilus TaxID=2583810 RepID=UPI00110D4273|nr:hypothetical protein [Alteribacter natronophilus]TMW73123.1 hypothetical protein FGB90_02085 [Alteribacter natronophilus]
MSNTYLTSSFVSSYCRHEKGTEPHDFQSVSRRADQVEPGDLFVPSCGAGLMEEVSLAQKRGALGILLKHDDVVSLKSPVNCTVYSSDDPEAALHSMAQAMLAESGPSVIGAAGEGKAEIALAAYSVFGSAFRVSLLSPEQRQNLTAEILNTPMDCEMFIIELPDDLMEIPEFLPVSHLIASGSRGETEQAERICAVADRLKASCVIICDAEEPQYERDWDKTTLTCGRSEGALFSADSLSKDGESHTFRVKGIDFRFSVPSEIRVKSALYAVAAGMHMGLSAEEIQNGLSNSRSVQ